jgi:hypothetical protein
MIIGTAGLLSAPASWSQLVVYEQNFDGLDAADSAALGTAGDGWLIFGLVFDGDPGAPPNGNFKFDYGNVFPAPNGGPGFSAIASGEGQGSPETDQYLNIYSDYNCCQPGQGHFDQSAPFDRVQSPVYQEQTIGAEDIGSTWYFSFDAKLPSSDGCSTTATSTCVAFIKTIDPNAGFSETNFITFDASTLDDSSWSGHSLQIDLTNPALEGQLLQFGFQSVSEQFGNTGVYFDNLSFSSNPPMMANTDVDATGLTDISGDAVPDVAVLKQLAGKRPRVRYYSGANRKKFAQVAYLSNAWAGVAAATLLQRPAVGTGAPGRGGCGTGADQLSE